MDIPQPDYHFQSKECFFTIVYVNYLGVVKNKDMFQKVCSFMTEVVATFRALHSSVRFSNATKFLYILFSKVYCAHSVDDVR